MSIPSYSDPENTTHSIRFEQTSIPNVVANLTGLNQLTISPKSFNEIGAHQTYIVLFDLFSEVKYSLSIVVTNTAPQFNSSSFNFSSTMQVNQTQINYFNFTYYDAENNSVAVTAKEIFDGITKAEPTSLIKLINPNQIMINSSLFADVGIHQIYIYISDAQPSTTINSFFINVTNTAPYFVAEVPPAKLRIKFN